MTVLGSEPNRTPPSVSLGAAVSPRARQISLAHRFGGGAEDGEYLLVGGAGDGYVDGAGSGGPVSWSGSCG